MSSMGDSLSQKAEVKLKPFHDGQAVFFFLSSSKLQVLAHVEAITT